MHHGPRIEVVGSHLNEVVVQTTSAPGCAGECGGVAVVTDPRSLPFLAATSLLGAV